MFVGRLPGNFDRLLDFTRANKSIKSTTLTVLRANHYRYVSMVAEFATWFANRFVRQWFARYQPHDSVHALHSQTHRRGSRE